ncbi:hypothetical protein CpipJ_CPIJ008169 [Culex quinquefasciatus]|uniref:Uncharacterized protein n=2 Tax=Culex pipiens complex TaxID=518105 RepID=B0WM70_CULQU|nr:hypothetical protein CpipJ_CPIJ008169 [Culex quinquefasciatus]|eukprot:XP_001849804.1 hypothetical protein CpipJ_CPIJ008169 [Culex quinquefasciatus]
MMFYNWNEPSINPSVRIKWRASLVPAAAVIPAPLAYIKIVAVKTFEVYSCPTRVLLLMMVVGHWIVATIRLGAYMVALDAFHRVQRFHQPSCDYLEQIRVL